MWNACISLFSITVGLYQGDFREIQGDPMLLTMIYLFLLVSVVLLLNLLIAQLNQTYEFINKDVLSGPCCAMSWTFVIKLISEESARRTSWALHA